MKRKIGNTICIIILIPLLIIAIRISYQSIFFPDKIPDIFGIKMFIVLDEFKDTSFEYGDLIITQNKEYDELKQNDTVAYRNGKNTVSINKYNSDNKEIGKGNVEGVVVGSIPKIGAILYFIQKPINMIIICGIIILCGGIWIYIAGRLDKRDKLLEEQNSGGQS